MKAFKFKLDSILKLRKGAESVAQQNHGAAGRRLETALSELAEAEEEQKRFIDKLAGVQRASFRPVDREILWNAFKYQKDLCGRLGVQVAGARKELEEKRQLLLAARADHEAMLKMQEKAQKEHTQLAQQEERSMIDDKVNARHSALQLLARR